MSGQQWNKKPLYRFTLVAFPVLINTNEPEEIKKELENLGLEVYNYKESAGIGKASHLAHYKVIESLTLVISFIYNTEGQTSAYWQWQRKQDDLRLLVKLSC